MGKRDSDMDDVTTLIVIGPMNLSKNPTNPVTPRNIWKTEATISDPDTLNPNKNEFSFVYIVKMVIKVHKKIMKIFLLFAFK